MQSPPSSGDSTGGTSSTSLDGNGGIWRGTISGGAFNGYNMVGIYAKDGTSKFWVYPSTEGATGLMIAPGTLTLNGNDYTGPYLGLPNGVSLPGNAATASGTLSGAVNSSDNSIAGSYQSGSDQGNYALAFDSDYTGGASQSDLLSSGNTYGFIANFPGSGSHAGAITGVLTMSADTQDSSTVNIAGTDLSGCSYAGSATVVNSKYDAYDTSITRSCAGSPDVVLSGLGAYYPSQKIFGALIDDGASVGLELVATVTTGS